MRIVMGNGSFSYDLGWWNEEHFNASGANGDGVLDITEFDDFLHPADSKSPKLLLWLCADVVRERDADNDGKLNLSEFFPGIFYLIRSGEEDYGSSDQDDEQMEALAKKVPFSNRTASCNWKNPSIRGLLCKTTSRIHHLSAHRLFKEKQNVRRAKTARQESSKIFRRFCFTNYLYR